MAAAGKRGLSRQEASGKQKNRDGGMRIRPSRRPEDPALRTISRDSAVLLPYGSRPDTAIPEMTRFVHRENGDRHITQVSPGNNRLRIDSACLHPGRGYLAGALMS